MDLDLGSNAKVNVKVNGGAHKMRVPTVRESQWYQKEISKKGSDAFDTLLSFIVKLGMPMDAAEELDLIQIRKLSEGLLAVSEKK